MFAGQRVPVVDIGGRAAGRPRASEERKPLNQRMKTVGKPNLKL
jgi:hypothetical protein